MLLKCLSKEHRINNVSLCHVQCRLNNGGTVAATIRVPGQQGEHSTKRERIKHVEETTQHALGTIDNWLLTSMRHNEVNCYRLTQQLAHQGTCT
jgi:hypothetical protein